MTCFKYILCIYSTLLLINFTSMSTQAATPLYKEIENRILNDISKIHPDADINIAFNLPKTQKKYTYCNNLSIPPIERLTSGGRLSVRLTCKTPKWSTYLSVKYSIYYPVASASKYIAKGQLLNIENLIFTRKDIAKLSYGYFTSPEDIIGMEVTRTLQKNQAISPNVLTLPLIIKKGDSVLIQIINQGLRITSIGTALQSGKVGQQIRVKNDRSLKTIKAYVQGKGRVTINP